MAADKFSIKDVPAWIQAVALVVAFYGYVMHKRSKATRVLDSVNSQQAGNPTYAAQRGYGPHTHRTDHIQ